MGFVTKLTSILGSGIVDTVADVADRFIQSPDEKAEFKLDIEKVMQQRDSEIEQTIRSELQAKERIIVAEMSQGDNYTKRARPTLVYFGLVMIALNYFVVPIIQLFMDELVDPFILPLEFWIAWGGAVSIYSVGRSMEKRGVRNTFTTAVNGRKPYSFFD